MITLKNVSKIYKLEENDFIALKNINLNIKEGEFLAILGPSGCGKSTLMHIIGALDVPTSGEYILNGINIEDMGDDKLAEVRNREIGFVFQAYNLLPRTTALNNVMLPMVYANVPKEQRIVRAKSLLERVGLGERLEHTSSQLSGGQQQRVAIARSLANNPKLILADEPTGNLATTQGEEIMAIFQDLNKAGHTIVMITHEAYIAQHARRVIHLRDGKIATDNGNHRQRKAKDLVNYTSKT